MLKIKHNWFSSESAWISNRKRTFFESLDAVEQFHKTMLIGRSSFSREPTGCLPIVNETVPAKRLFRSGTTSIVSNREYRYSQPEFDLLNRHHIWKIEHLYGLEEPGNVIWIAAADYELKRPDHIFGPEYYIATGQQNSTYNLLYNHHFSKDDWRFNLELAKGYKPKFVRSSPSTIEAMYYYAGEFRFDCPLILSEETLHENVRQIAQKMFSVVIDKMVGWDGCLGWYECPYGTKHIYDEFCYVEELEDEVLAVTDLHNRAMIFNRYLIGDRGRLGKKRCECGIAGNYLHDFGGKTIESLYANGKLISGRFLSEKLSVLFRLGFEFTGDEQVPFDPKMVYRIRQSEDLNIEFIYSSQESLSFFQKEKISKMLQRLVPMPVVFVRESFPCFDKKKKNLFIESDYVKKFCGIKKG
jgi:hypothetical protein